MRIITSSNSLRLLPLGSLTFAMLAGVGSAAHANAFFINEHDAKVTGRGDAATATDVDPSAIVYNPGGISVGQGTRFMIGGSLVAASGAFTPTGGAKTTTGNAPAVLPQIYVTSRVHDMLTVGIGFHTPFGLAIKWDDNAPITDTVHNEALHTFFISPVVGVNLDKFVPGLSFGGGVDLVPATVELNQDLYFGTDRGTASLAANAFGVGARMGAMWHPRFADKLSLGVMYRTPVKLDFTGTGNFNAPAEYRGQLPPDGDVSTSLTLPQMFAGGLAYRPNQKLEVELDVSWVGWSSFKSLDIKLPDMTTQSSPRDYQDKTTVRFGVEYALPSVRAAVRAGYIYDPTPILATRLTAELPDADRHNLTVGASYSLGNYDVHFGLLWVIPRSRATEVDAMNPAIPGHQGTYEFTALVTSLTLAGHFGGPSKASEE
jgi:long-chain fatty acid transport protein